jgi:micrococcal nuclease
MYEYRIARVDKVVDGDTIDAYIDLGFSISFFSRIRLAGIDTPESRTTDKLEKALGLEVKDFLKSKLKDAENIVIRTEKPDSSEKYGRILGWLFINGEAESLNKQMIEKGYAWDYDGGTKQKDFDLLKQRRLAN